VLAQPTYFVRSTTSWMPHPWRFHGWAAMPAGSRDLADPQTRDGTNNAVVTKWDSQRCSQQWSFVGIATM